MPGPTRSRSWEGSSASGGTRSWLDRRSLKTHMHMEMLRTKSPEMVHKEGATHLLAYTLIRGVRAEAVRSEGIAPRRLSFKGSLHTVREFEAVHRYDPQRIERDLPLLVWLIGQKRVGDRPDRYEPRAVKRGPKPHPLLRLRRKTARALIKLEIISYEKTKYNSVGLSVATRLP
jgi:hypothetical protein